MGWALTQTVLPTAEPVTLAEAKAYARILQADEDDLIADLIGEARQYAERVTRRQLMTATWTWTFDNFPESNIIYVPYPPLQSVSSITYVDTDGVTQTWDSSKYDVHIQNEPALITLAYGESYPDVRGDANGITITFVAGYASAVLVPGVIKRAIMQTVGQWFEFREPHISGTILTPIPMSVESLLSMESMPEIV